MREADHTPILEELFLSTYEFIKDLILRDLDWNEFTTSFNAWETIRRQHIHTDILPTLACIAAGGDAGRGTPLSACWTLILFSARIFDDIQDDQVSGSWMNQGLKKALPIALSASSVATTTCLSCLDVDKNTKDAVLTVMGKAFLMAAKSQAIEPTSVEDYFRKVAMSTSSTIAAAVWCGGYIATNDTELLQALYNYGLNAGIAASIIADCQDLYPSTNKVSDLATKNATLPILYAKSLSGMPGNEALMAFWETTDTPSDADVQEIVKLLEDMGAISWSYQVAQSYQQKAIMQLDALSNWAKEGLVNYVS